MADPSFRDWWIDNALLQADGNRDRAAASLRLSRETVRDYIFRSAFLQARWAGAKVLPEPVPKPEGYIEPNASRNGDDSEAWDQDAERPNFDETGDVETRAVAAPSQRDSNRALVRSTKPNSSYRTRLKALGMSDADVQLSVNLAAVHTMHASEMLNTIAGGSSRLAMTLLTKIESLSNRLTNFVVTDEASAIQEKTLWEAMNKLIENYNALNKQTNENVFMRAKIEEITAKTKALKAGGKGASAGKPGFSPLVASPTLVQINGAASVTVSQPAQPEPQPDPVDDALDASPGEDPNEGE